MLRVGLIGGMSWESSALYYRLLNEGVRSRLGGLHSAECLLMSVDFADVEAMQSEGRWSDAAETLSSAARDLKAGGAELLLLCTNTMHKVADEVQPLSRSRCCTWPTPPRRRRRRRDSPGRSARYCVHDGAGLLPAACARTASRCWSRPRGTARRCTTSSTTSSASAWCGTHRGRSTSASSRTC